MIKKSYQLFCLVLLLCVAQFRLQAQNADLKWSRIFSQSEFEKRLPKLFASDKSSVYSYYIRKKSLHILKFDRENLERGDDYEISLEGKNRKEKTLQMVVLSNDKIFIVTQQYDKSEDMNYLFCTRLSTNGDVEIENDVIESREVSKSKYIGDYKYILSPDESKLLLFHDVAAKEKKALEKYDFKVYDFEKMELLWEGETQLPQRDKYTSTHNIKLDNLGRVWLQASYFSTDDKVNRFKLLTYSKGSGDEMQEVDFESSQMTKTGTKIGGWGFTFDDENNIICYGNYGRDFGKRRRKYTLMTGAFVIKLNAKTFSIVNEDFKSLKEDNNREEAEEEEEEEDEVKGKNKKKKESRPAETGYSNLELKEAIIMDDVIYLLSEINYLIVSCTRDPKTGRESCTYYYHSENVFVTKVNKEGRIEWTSKLNKEQRITGTDQYNSFVTNNSSPVKLIYLEHGKNFKKAAGRNLNEMEDRTRTYSLKKSSAALAEVDDNGKGITISELYNVKANGKYIAIPKSSLYMEGNQILLLTVRKSKFRLLKVTFPDA